MSIARRWILSVHAAALVIWIGLAAAVESKLPAQIATHLDFSGRVTGRAPMTPFAWYALPVLGTLIFALIAGIAHFSASRPQMFNIPDKARLLALPEAERRGVTEILATALCAFGLWEFGTLALVHWSLYRASVDRAAGPTQMLSVMLLVSGAVTIFAIGFGMVKLSSHIDHVEKRVASRQQTLRAS